jgi:hypothetical protein
MQMVGLQRLCVPPQHRFGLYDQERGSPAAEPPTRGAFFVDLLAAGALQGVDLQARVPDERWGADGRRGLLGARVRGCAREL